MQTLLTDSTEAAAEHLRKSDVVIFSTETVFGIGASAYDHRAIERLYTIKKRPADNPLILHLSDWQQAFKLAELNEKARLLMKKYKSGPLTIILPKKDRQLFTAGLNTVALRVPLYQKTREMIGLAGVPVAAPSANISGRPSLTRFSDVVEVFTGRVDCILKGPDPEIGIESTVIDLTAEKAVLLRPGYISRTELSKILPELNRAETVSTGSEEAEPRSPGLKYRHYAPECRVHLVEKLPEQTGADDARIGFKMKGRSGYDVITGSNEEYMHLLYSFLHECDRRGIQTAYCALPAPDHFREALLNRLYKASGTDSEKK